MPRRQWTYIMFDEDVTRNEYGFFSNSLEKRKIISLGQKYKQFSIIYGDVKKCEEVCTVPFTDYSVGDVVKTLDLSSAKDIFLSKITASACMKLNDLNKTTFHLTEVNEMF